MTSKIENNPVDVADDPPNAFVAMPVPHRFVPHVTSLLATLYAGESGTARGATTLQSSADPDAPAATEPAPTAAEDERDPEGLRIWSGAHPVWTTELYAALIDKGVISSDRMVAFMDHLPTGRDSACEIPDLAATITAAGSTITAEEINVALRWFGKFTHKAFPETDGHVWPFEISRQDYPKGYTGTRRLVFWFEPEQAEAWRKARA